MSETPPAATVTTNPRQRVNAPSIALMIVGIVGGLWALLMVLVNLLWGGLGAMMPQDAGQEGLSMMLSGGLGTAAYLVGVLVAVFIVWAAAKMKKLQSWWAAVAASIVAMVPCISPCCLIGLPIGIWCLVILFDDKVKSAFS